MSIDIDIWLSKLREGHIIPEADMYMVCEYAKEVMGQESNLVQVKAPVTVAGDIHGQFYDLLHLFEIGGELPGHNYVFLGDYVDRGHHSVETIEYLIMLKLKYPSHITLLRGNHETRQVTMSYGLYDEIGRKYGNTIVWQYLTDLFDYFPIAAVIEDKIFCVHGGLSPKIKQLSQINAIDRKIEIPHEGAYCDLMWSDPDDIDDWKTNFRGAGYLFGAEVVNQFNHINGLELIARAHQLVNEGYKYWFDDENLVTVWSAPNYCYRCGNVASVLQFDQYLNKNFEMFKAVPDSKKVTEISKFMPYFL